MNIPTTADLLKYADLQMAAEAFLVDKDNGALKADLQPGRAGRLTRADLKMQRRNDSVTATQMAGYACG